MLRAGRAQELNREVVRRLATGELAAWTIDSQLGLFIATHAAAYSERVSRLTAAFLTGMIQMGSLYSYELVDRILPGAMPSPDLVSPPDIDPSISPSWLEDLSRFASEENARGLARLRLVMDRVAAGELVPADLQDISTQFHSERAWASTTRLVELYLDLLSGLEDVHASFNEEFLRSALGMSPDTSEPDAVVLEAPLGERVTVKVAVANTEPETAAVTCALTGVRRADGVGPAFDPHVIADPEHLELAPGAEAVVGLTIHADAEHFEPGVRYDTVLRVANDERTLLELPVTVNVTASRVHADEDE
jgi:hypothetical protein